ncbi:MAG TPA: maltose alpha-D-glucosyltransferase, partial [Polyangiaceae bacterium]
RSIYDSNGDGIGDFAGLCEKLDYLEDLGVTAIWLLPFYPSPGRDDGYDIADYGDIHPDLGSMADFERLIEEAHKRNIKVITELVLNHTSDQHPWFQRARRAPAGSAERDFYVWTDTPTKYKEARIIFQDFEPSNWTWDREANAYFWHRFFSHQPDLNFHNPAVQEALFGVVDFWLSKGVDGLRLDAVPYLYEEEGTNCENLPETHAFLKKLRAHVDAKFENRMLLAEANQWPEDAAAYFGDGDECHMNFHFPMMPRMFMAIHMEDRLPITDILAQTPEIPEGSQWAIFLRNHDELTLEMVTDEERDYMYRAYAQEPTMKINLGIRRRLAPLVGNSRRKMELLNALLFSLPGTPVLYYGDEIGMGDNVFLGDRNGVRTPMQWSSDRNAGFSRANPQRLILPIIIDPEYHYESINVENQQQASSSMLWWTKRLIALRKRFRAFGRGSITFLHPSNSRVLVYTRRFENEIVLCVANLSRFVQYAELDLAEFKGMIPVEMFGKTKFPAIGELPYMVTLAPHNFYWFSLQSPGAIAERLSSPVLLPPIESANETTLFTTDKEQVADAIQSYCDLRNWFGDTEHLRKVELTDVFRLKSDKPIFVAMLRADLTDAPPETYAITLAVVGEESHPAPEAIVAHLKLAGQTRFLVEAVHEDESARALFAATSTPQRLPNGRAELLLSRFAPAPSGDAPTSTDLRRLGAQRRKATLRFGDDAVMKVFQRVDDGLSTELEIGRVLNTKEGALAPMLRSAVEVRYGRAQPQTVALVHDFVPNVGNGWVFTIEELGRFFDRVLTRPADEALPPVPT